MKILIHSRDGVFGIAADIFASMHEKITGFKQEIVFNPPEGEDMVIIGSDSDNSFVHELMIQGIVPDLGIASGSDEYRILSVKRGKQNILILAGGGKRGQIYAVYSYFEQCCGCEYFWDGDRIPHLNAVPLEGFNITEKPRFTYRGLRYFAHRSLTRFQAEHWGPDDWKKELDWCLKKRLNFFMPRIGIDDLFQKAFPDIVPYPERDGKLPEALDRSYDDRNLFWSLQYRGELRKTFMNYAKERGLICPEDCGTMTHWYSRTPYAFLNQIKPEFLPQASLDYAEKTGLVWDITQDKYLDYYWKLTETNIREYGSGEMFHTIGLAERGCYADRKKNHEMKLYTYRRIQKKLREKYPNAPLLIGSWDFVARWTPQQVHELLREMNPENTILFDYVSDIADEINNFTNWNVMGRFPYFFGIFQALESCSHIRGNYDVIERRLPKAAADSMCKGMVLWAENSHADTLMLEYLAANAWAPVPENVNIDVFLNQFTRKRYGEVPQHDVISDAWHTLMPLIRTDYWRIRVDSKCRDSYSFAFNPILRDMFYLESSSDVENFEYRCSEIRPLKACAAEVFRILAKLNFSRIDDFIFRDAIDLARTQAFHMIEYGAFSGQCILDSWRKHIGDSPERADEIKKHVSSVRCMMECLADLLAAHEDYSLYDSLKRLESIEPVNPNFEHTLKGNAETWYCRSFIYELIKGCCIPELKAIEKSLFEKIDADDRSFSGKPEYLNGEREKIQDTYYDTPLEKLAPNHAEARRHLNDTLLKMADIADFLTR